MVERIRNQGFSLLELLVVVSIIALLTGILIPSLAKVRSTAKRTACMSNLHSAAVGFRMYLNTYDDYMPPAARYPSLKLNDKKPLSVFLVPFLAAPETLLCPADNGQQRPDYSEPYYESEGSSYEY
ncbi:MAG: type II secretion system protein [Planctomycetota bacterium]|jgi:prepilin-type N-terminal cleavage/methylation domain-containing protein